MDQTAPVTSTTAAATESEKLWIMLSHLSLLLGVGFLLPLIVYFVKRESSPATAAHAKEALLFHISVMIYLFASFVLMFVFVGFLTFPAVIIMSIVCAILACIKASEGGFYRYPLTIRFF